jgi:glycerophosphoryl diester phosphodiesterase
LVLVGVCVLALLLVVDRAPWRAARAARPLLLAHRGTHQTFDCPGLDYYEGCSATCIRPPTHGFLENTIPSMRAAFAYGADVVELDVHSTADGQLAVFHDWRLECRTNGSGITREQRMSYLKTLDIGFGYTADGGRSFPFRGQGVGLMPTLLEVLDEFPRQRFLIHFKGDEAADGDLLADELLARPISQRRSLMVYGGERPTRRALTRVPELRGLTREGVKSCLVRYALLGWSGHVPQACADGLVVLPLSYARLLWGWPHRFVDRMQRSGIEVVIEQGSETAFGLDDADALARLPNGFRGGIWTDRIERVGPLLSVIDGRVSR